MEGIENIPEGVKIPEWIRPDLRNEDGELKQRFTLIAKQLTENEGKIVAELQTVQGKPVDIGGYYQPNPDLASKAMRPSPTFNAIIDS